MFLWAPLKVGPFCVTAFNFCKRGKYSRRHIQSKTTWLMFIHPKFVYKQKNFPKFQSFLFFKNTPKYDKLSKISNISIKTMLELRTKFGNFGNFGHISDGLRKQYSVGTQCCNLIGSEPLYIPCNVCHVDVDKHRWILSILPHISSIDY